MKDFIPFIVICSCIGLLMSIIFMPVRAQPNIIPSAAGLVARADGSVIIDSWKDYSASRIENPAAPTPKITHRDLPTKITIGYSVNSSVSVCFEKQNSTSCFSLEQLRKLEQSK